MALIVKSRLSSVFFGGAVDDMIRTPTVGVVAIRPECRDFDLTG